MKILVAVTGIGARMRRFGEDRAIDRLRAAIGERNRQSLAAAGAAAIKPDDDGVEAISVQLKR